MTRLLAGVIGDPVTHSLSPRLHNFWLAGHGIDGAYVKLPVARRDFSRALEGLRACGFAGVNVTVPHKEAAFAVAAAADHAAIAAGAANLLLFLSNGRIAARNTDADGLKASLLDELPAAFLEGKEAVILGAGGAARAAVLALDDLGAGRITLINRSLPRTHALLASVAPYCRAGLNALGWEGWTAAAPGTALVVHCTPAGMQGGPPLDLPLDVLPASAVVCDIVYRPLRTALLRDAEARGLRTIDGLGMLMHQAAPSFAALFGVTPAVSPALRAHLLEALDG